MLRERSQRMISTNWRNKTARQNDKMALGGILKLSTGLQMGIGSLYRSVIASGCSLIRRGLTVNPLC